METDRPQGSNSSNNSSSSTSELFICFTSRLSSSSMKISSKSILSPGRSREPSQISLSTSLSRRLRTNGSMKGGQASPMFPTNAKKRGCSFENPEPSSPKVTCIGQVRVKSKKQGKKMRTRSQRRGEVSFRKVEQTNNNNNSNNNNYEDLSHTHVDNQFLNHQQQQQECLPHRNQKWVHLPSTICETLRAFGAEFNCFLPCRSSCMASEKEEEEKAAAASSNGGSSCGAVFAQWLVAVQEADGKGREIGLVVGEEEAEEEEESTERRRSYRRHIFEEIDFKEEKYDGANEGVEEGGGEEEEDEEAEARVNICVPPKNALLLMRCRSDPVKMAALANKFWEPPVPNVDDEEEEEEEEEEETEDNGNDEEEKNNSNNAQVEAGDEEGQTKIEQEMKGLIKEKWVSCDTDEEHQIHETQIIMEEQDNRERNTDIGCEKAWNLVEQEEETEIEVNHQETLYSGPSSQKETEYPKRIEIQESEYCQEHMQTKHVEEQESKLDYELVDSSVNVLSVQPEQESKSEAVQELAIQESKEQKEITENHCTLEGGEVGGEEESVTHGISESEKTPKIKEGQTGLKSKEKESPPLLPDCLLLMMCEPKLSMEVSKETWVCSTDFVRWLPEHSRPVKNKDGRDEPKKRSNVGIHPPQVHSDMQQPPRSSCSYPARAAGAESMSTAIEKKLVGSKAYEPYVLTRCKSEPMRSAAKVAPEACFWKNRKLEPHRPATLGVGAAGVGC